MSSLVLYEHGNFYNIDRCPKCVHGYSHAGSVHVLFYPWLVSRVSHHIGNKFEAIDYVVIIITILA